MCLTVVLVVQALLFADGGLSALGLNVLNMALIGTFGGYAVFWLVRAVLPTPLGGVPAAAGVAAAIGVVLASIAFTHRVRHRRGRAAPRSRPWPAPWSARTC